MKIENRKTRVSFSAGTTLNEAVQKCIEFCKEYQTEVELNFNGTRQTITRHTNSDSIVDGWYK
jgi:hypothetical protein